MLTRQMSCSESENIYVENWYTHAQELVPITFLGRHLFAFKLGYCYFYVTDSVTLLRRH
jgi:hypothetical protein